MKLFRIISTFFVISSGIVIAYFIVNNSAPATSLTANKQPQNTSSTNEYKPPFEWLEKVVSSGSSGVSPQNNLTAALGQTLVDQIKGAPDILNYQTGKLPTTDINSMSDKLTGNFFNESQLNLISDINDSGLKISRDNSVEAKKKYLDSVAEITKKNFGDFNRTYVGVVYETYGKNNPSYAGRLADIYKNLSGDYFTLVVPSDWIDFHRRAILYFKNAEIVYRAMANYQTDPIKGYLALEMVQSLTDNSVEIQNMLIKKVQEMK